MSRARLLVLALVLAVAAGCGVKGTMAPNAAPETVVFVEGPVDTVNHVVHLRWFGSDVDGQVVRYEYKFIYQAGQEPSGYDSSAWFSTVRKDSIFAVYTPNGYSMPTFVIRSIDDEGIADPTPARQTFQFKNDPPFAIDASDSVHPLAKKFDHPPQAVHVDSSGKLTITFLINQQVGGGTFPFINAIEVTT